MEIAIYAKKRTTKEGKSFYSYLATIKRKDGSEQTVSVKFRDAAGTPEPRNCPMNIMFEKRDANLSSHDFIREDTGEPGTSYTLWISKWEEGSPFVDTSLDDYE